MRGEQWHFLLISNSDCYGKLELDRCWHDCWKGWPWNTLHLEMSQERWLPCFLKQHFHTIAFWKLWYTDWYFVLSLLSRSGAVHGQSTPGMDHQGKRGQLPMEKVRGHRSNGRKEQLHQQWGIQQTDRRPNAERWWWREQKEFRGVGRTKTGSSNQTEDQVVQKTRITDTFSSTSAPHITASALQSSLNNIH